MRLLFLATPVHQGPRYLVKARTSPSSPPRPTTTTTLDHQPFRTAARQTQPFSANKITRGGCNRPLESARNDETLLKPTPVHLVRCSAPSPAAMPPATAAATAVGRQMASVSLVVACLAVVVVVVVPGSHAGECPSIGLCCLLPYLFLLDLPLLHGGTREANCD